MVPPALLLLLLLLLWASGQQTGASDALLERDFRYAAPAARCSYTFVVPQQRSGGAICVNAREPEALLEGRVNKQELALLHGELQEQRRRLEALQLAVELDGGVVAEVKLLRKESRSTSARVTALYTQLLHEVLRQRDAAPEEARLERRVLQNTQEAGRLAARYRDLDHRYQHLEAGAANQSARLLQLEERCRRGGGAPDGEPVVADRSRPARPPPPASLPQPPVQMPPASPGGYRPFHPPSDRRHAHRHTYNQIQNDQNAKAPPLPAATAPSAAGGFTGEPSGPFKDCLEALEAGHGTDGMYLLKPDGGNQLMQVWCDQTHDPGGWTVIQRRQDGAVNFFRNWETYKQGFGNIDGEYWLGLENVYWLTSQGPYKLLVSLEDWTGRKTFAEYASFRVEAEADFYRLRVGRYHGSAGDSLTWHNGKQFTTLDRDRDVYTGNCAHYQKGGWWYNACAHSNLNGVWYRGGHYRSRYQDGVYWAEFRGGAYSLKKVTMMIRPNENTVH
ncbi:Angiopoietin-related protein 2 [Liparis tanakae]|uniref:Angiopoietin-related protein 2 n=1 Tax=Liparis tanakae TaxID=230148 RepID=A0A4Z2F1Z9_9TELE|nr:Angiopoietin-related protein 2 [Liparis tanakae]